MPGRLVQPTRQRDREQDGRGRDRHSHQDQAAPLRALQRRHLARDAAVTKAPGDRRHDAAASRARCQMRQGRRPRGGIERTVGERGQRGVVETLRSLSPGRVESMTQQVERIGMTHLAAASLVVRSTSIAVMRRSGLAELLTRRPVRRRPVPAVPARRRARGRRGCGPPWHWAGRESGQRPRRAAPPRRTARPRRGPPC